MRWPLSWLITKQQQRFCHGSTYIGCGVSLQSYRWAHFHAYFLESHDFKNFVFMSWTWALKSTILFSCAESFTYWSQEPGYLSSVWFPKFFLGQPSSCNRWKFSGGGHSGAWSGRRLHPHPRQYHRHRGRLGLGNELFRHLWIVAKPSAYCRPRPGKDNQNKSMLLVFYLV